LVITPSPASRSLSLPGAPERRVAGAAWPRGPWPPVSAESPSASTLAVGMGLAVRLEVLQLSSQALGAAERPPRASATGAVDASGLVVDGEARLVPEAATLELRPAAYSSLLGLPGAVGGNGGTIGAAATGGAARAMAARALAAYRRVEGGGTLPPSREVRA